MEQAHFTIGLLIFPRMTQLDFTGPFEVFARIPDTKVHVLWKTIEPITSDTGLAILPTTTLDDCPALDLICIPGGPGQIALMDDEQRSSRLFGDKVFRQSLSPRYAPVLWC